MSNGFRPLERLRRRRAWLRAVLPLVALGGLGTAGPCAAANAQAQDVAAATATDVAQDAHAHALAQQHAHAQGHADAQAGGHADAHAGGHAHERHLPCPHCLPDGLAGLAHDASGHGQCAALPADLSDGARQPAFSTPDLKHAAPCAWTAPPAAVPASPTAVVDTASFHPPDVSLNLRFCVLLI